MNLFERIKNQIEDFIYNMKNGFKNLIFWFPVIWKDRWYDHHFIYIILRKKLIQMEKLFREKGHHINHTKDADKIRLAIYLLNRLIKDEYQDMVFKPHDKKWGQLNLKMTDLPEDPKYVEVNFSRPNAKTPEEKEQEKKEFMKLWKHIEYLNKQDIEYLFNWLGKHIRSWWD